MKTAAPYDRWESPITPEMLSRKRLSFPTFVEPDAIAWLESRPSEGGRQTVMLRAGDGAPRELIPAPFNARTRVHEYGGLPFVFAGTSLVFSNDADAALYRVDDALGSPTPPARLTPSDELHGGKVRIAEPVWDRARNRLVAVAEVHTKSRYPENGIVSVDLATGAIEWLVQGHDFFAAPALSPDGRELAFLTWDHPSMPWDAAALRVADLADDGSLKRTSAIAGGPSGSAFQPTYAPHGELYFALEAPSSGGRAWSLHRRRTGAIERVLTSDDEWGAPLWNLGTTTFGFTSKSTIVGAAMRDGAGHLVEVDVGRVQAKATDRAEYGHIGQLTARPGRGALFTSGWAGSGASLVLAVEGKPAAVIEDVFAPLFEGGEAVLSRDDVSTAEAIAFHTTDGEIAHGWFYAPRSARFEAPPESGPPPLMVLAHGGPTGCASPTFSLAVQQFTTRGFAVLDVNYRGSTGFGRDYREKLRGRWGEADVDDCVKGALALADAGRVDRRRLFIRGGSAGGFVVLMALCTYPDVFAAATCLYGISDPKTIGEETHKFESHYDRYLFGDADARARAFEARAPLLLADRIRTPVIFFHGKEDKAVPVSQTERLHAALRASGVRTEFHAYDGEQHGFRRAETLRDVASRELAFLLATGRA
ncbi:MAG: prolyl oligopeptidase family serine peptidase [Polyangiaceae bacterium]